MKFKSKIKKFYHKHVKKVVAFGMCLCVMVCSAVTCFAAEPYSDVAPDAAAQQVFDQISQQINFTNILAIIGVALMAALGIVLGWWAIRKVYRMVMSAFTKGKASL